MPERWETELHKLREVRPPADLDARIAEGPHGDPPPPAARRVVAAVTAFALFAAAGAFAFVVFRNDGSNGVVGGAEDPQLVLELLSTDRAPTATLRYGDERVDVVTEGYEWCDGDQCAGMIADFSFYPPVGEYLVVPPGTPIEVTGDGTVGSVRVTDPDDQRIAGASGLVVPSANGRYVFAFTGEFERGEGSFFFGVQALDAPTSAPDVLEVDCSAGIARTDTAIVRTQPDGLHVVATGTDGRVGIGIVTPGGATPEGVSSVELGLPVDGSTGLPVPPGDWEIGCASGDRPVEAGEATVPFELVDPDDHWAPAELACEDSSEEAFSSSIPSSIPHEDATSQLLDGLVEGDRIRGAGYAAETWEPGPVYVVDRGGEAVAQLVLSPQETYRGTFRACSGSGIQFSSLGVIEGIPDVLFVRCEGLGPAVDTPTVRLQPDGLHVEASNIADATVVEVNSEGAVAVSMPFTEVTERFVAEVGPGVVSIGCRVQDEEGNVVGGPEEVPEAYIEVEVLPVED